MVGLVSSTQCLTGISVWSQGLASRGVCFTWQKHKLAFGMRVNGQSSCRASRVRGAAGTDGSSTKREQLLLQPGLLLAAPLLSLSDHLSHCLLLAPAFASVTVTVTLLPQNNLCTTWTEYEEDLLFSWWVTWWISPGWVRKWNVLLVLAGESFLWSLQMAKAVYSVKNDMNSFLFLSVPTWTSGKPGQ